MRLSEYLDPDNAAGFIKQTLGRLADFGKENSKIISYLSDMPERDRTAVATSMVPGVGDVAGVRADVMNMVENPEERTLANAGWLAAGALPFVPSRSQVGPIRDTIKAYHGSPHDFDKFQMSQIGTGEGAQAYGHGLYFAESEDVARGYRDALTSSILVDGNPVSNMTTDVAERALLDSGFDVDQAIDDLGSAAARYDGVDSVIGRVKREGFEKNIAKLEDIKSRNAISRPEGHMYQVEIDASPDEFLDWDLPLSEQGQAAQDALGYTQKSYDGNPEKALRDFLETDYAKSFPEARDVKWAQTILDDPEYDAVIDGQAWLESQMRSETGSSFYNLLGNDKAGSAYERAAKDVGGQAALSQRLSAKGIKGIRYKDGFSRGADGGTSNYVVFDENLISIAKKYGIAIPVAAAMVARQTGQDPEELYQKDIGALTGER